MKQRRFGNQDGFTMIELIMVIVILGILAAVAIPKFVDMRTEARVAQADGVLAAAEGACAINFAKGALDKAGYTAITTGATLLAAMEDTPKGWTAGTTTTTNLCMDANSDSDCTAADTYIINVGTVEVKGTTKAVLTKNW